MATEELVEDLVIDDDRNLIQPGDAALLIVEDDITFARILVDLAHDRGLKALVALRGASAMSLAREFKPGAITLDINLPDMAGWTILDRLKHDPATRHIPVHIISGDENRRRGLALGAMTYLEKSVTNDSLAEAFAAIEHSAAEARQETAGGVRRRNASGKHDRDAWARRTSRLIGVATAGEALGGGEAAISGWHRGASANRRHRAHGAGGGDPKPRRPVRAAHPADVRPAADAGRGTGTGAARPCRYRQDAFTRASGCSMNPCCCCIAPKPIWRRSSAGSWNSCAKPT